MSGVDDEPGGGGAGRAAGDLLLLERLPSALAAPGATGALLPRAAREVRAAVPAAGASRPLTDRSFADHLPSSSFGPDHTTAVTVKKAIRRRARCRALDFGIFMGPSYKIRNVGRRYSCPKLLLTWTLCELPEGKRENVLFREVQKRRAQRVIHKCLLSLDVRNAWSGPLGGQHGTREGRGVKTALQSSPILP